MIDEHTGIDHSRTFGQIPPQPEPIKKTSCDFTFRGSPEPMRVVPIPSSHPCAIHMLAAYRDCGCMSHAIALDEQTPVADVTMFYVLARHRRSIVREFQPDDEIPDW